MLFKRLTLKLELREAASCGSYDIEGIPWTHPVQSRSLGHSSIFAKTTVSGKKTVQRRREHVLTQHKIIVPLLKGSN